MTFRKTLRACALFAAFAPATISVCEAAPVVPLSFFEQRAALNPRLQAAEEAFAAARQGVRAEGARSGARIVVQGMTGPQRQVVARDLITQSFHYGQSIGLNFPLYAAKAAQREAVAQAQADETDAKAALDETRRRLLADVREAYVAYWLAARQGELARAYGDDLARNVQSARALHIHGFWTDADYFAYLDKVEQSKTDRNKAALDAQEALATLRSIAGGDLKDFEPDLPISDEAPIAPLSALLLSASAHDVELEHDQAQVDRFVEFERYAKRHSVDANITTAAGSEMSIPNGVGYGLNAGISLSLPTHAEQADVAYQRQLDGELASWRDMRQARISELSAAVEKAFDERLSAVQDLDASGTGVSSAREDLRETRFRFENIAGTTLNAVLQKTASSYTGRRNQLTLHATVMTKTYELFFLAPDAGEK
jgi:outer membrane protein TolC